MSPSSSSLNIPQLLAMSAVDLAHQDIAAVHLACAVGLPGSEGLDIGACLKRLDEWTDRVRQGISRAMLNRPCFPEYAELSEAEYKILTMFAVLYRHLGLTVNTGFNEGPYDGRDSRNQFIHAVLMEGYPVTCCTAPVIFAAIGRRLGFPIKLVKAREHIFCRWDGANERFNIEATDRGYYRRPDESYHSYPRPIWMEAVEQGILMRSLLSHEELALFLGERGHCYLENLITAEATNALYHACRVDPREPFLRNRWKIATLIHRAVEEAINQGTPDAIQIPAPQEGWESSVYPGACNNLCRILSNRGPRVAAGDVNLYFTMTT